MNACNIYEAPAIYQNMILKMNFNFNIKDMLVLAGQSIRRVTNVLDLHRTGNRRIKRKQRSASHSAVRHFLNQKQGVSFS
jgi:hypothetical protein